MLGMRRPSLTSSGSMEKVVMVRSQGTSCLTRTLSPSTKVSRQTGTAASNMDFSWTWNEKRKKVKKESIAVEPDLGMVYVGQHTFHHSVSCPSHIPG